MNPADRNNDGRVDARDLTGQHASGGGLTGHSTTHHSTTGHGTSSDPLTGALAAPLGQGALGAHGTDPSGPHNTRTANILDPHVNTGAGGYSSNTGGMGHNTTGGGLTGHGTSGHSTTGGYGHTANPADRNNDGRVDARDLTGQGHSTTGGHSGAGGALGHDHRTSNMEHRQGESGDMPRALTEDVSRAQPHGFTEENHHSTGNTTHGKPSMMDKLNPKVDSNHDGKAGFMK